MTVLEFLLAMNLILVLFVILGTGRAVGALKEQLERLYLIAHVQDMRQADVLALSIKCRWEYDEVKHCDHCLIKELCEFSHKEATRERVLVEGSVGQFS